jgi:hypothetical protein
MRRDRPAFSAGGITTPNFKMSEVQQKRCPLLKHRHVQYPKGMDFAAKGSEGNEFCNGGGVGSHEVDRPCLDAIFSLT